MLETDFVSTHRTKALKQYKQHEKWRNFMTDHERRISGLPANDYRVENYIANGVSGRDFEVLDADVAPSTAPVDIDFDAWDQREREFVDELLLAGSDESFESEVISVEFARSLGTPALPLEARVA